jgi:hypothetical protein
VDGDVENEERDGETQDRRVLDDRAGVESRSEDDEEQQHEEPVHPV